MAYKLLPENSSVPTQESLPATALRTGLRTAARAGETVLGLPGDIAQAGFGVANYLTGGAVPSYSDIQEKLPVSLPTSENIKEAHEKHLTGEYLKPQGQIEEIGDELTSLITSLISPAKGAVGLVSKASRAQALSKIPKAAKVGSAAILGKELVKGLGGEGLAQEGTKLGILLASGLPGGKKALEQKANDAYKIVSKVPESAHIQAPHLESTVSRLKKYTSVGHLTEDKKAVQEFVDSVERSLQKGHRVRGEAKKLINKGLPVKEAVQLEKDANQLIRDYKLPKQARPYLIDIKKDITKSLEDYGQKNPSWLDAYQESKDIYRGLNDRSTVNEFLQDNFDLKDLLTNKFVKALMFGGATFLAPAKIGVPIATGVAVNQIVKNAETLFKSKHAAKYYKDALEAALKDNRNGFIQSMKKLDQVANKELPSEGKGKWRLE